MIKVVAYCLRIQGFLQKDDMDCHKKLEVGIFSYLCHLKAATHARLEEAKSLKIVRDVMLHQVRVNLPLRVDSPLLRDPLVKRSPMSRS